MAMPTSPAILLLQREFQNLKRRPMSSDYAIHEFLDENIFAWIVFLFGPSGTPFEGATFKALMRFPPDYPNDPPSLQFLSEIFHPNVFRDGKLCISSLQIPPPDASVDESRGFWTPALGVHGALESVVSLIGDPNPDDPANAEAASVFTNDRSKFSQKASDLSKLSNKDLPHGFIRPILCSPPLAREDSGKSFRRTLEKDDDYEYSSDDYQEMEEEEEAE